MERLRLGARGLVFDTLAAGRSEGSRSYCCTVPTDCRLLDRVAETLAAAGYWMLTPDQ